TAYHHSRKRSCESTNSQRLPARSPFGCLRYFVAHLTTSQPSVRSGIPSGSVTRRSAGDALTVLIQHRHSSVLVLVARRVALQLHTHTATRALGRQQLPSGREPRGKELPVRSLPGIQNARQRLGENPRLRPIGRLEIDRLPRAAKGVVPARSQLMHGEAEFRATDRTTRRRPVDVRLGLVATAALVGALRDGPASGSHDTLLSVENKKRM